MPTFDTARTLKGKVALVTGGASGIGEAIAKRLASEGAKVVVADINDVAAKDVAAAIEAAGGVAAAFRQDVASKEDNEAAVQFAVDTFGALHLAVNNAGVGDHTPLADKDLADWDKVIAINGGDGPMYKATADILRSQGARISWASNLTINALGIRGLNQFGRNERYLIWYVDVRNEEHIKIWIEETIELWGPIYGFVNLGWGSRLNMVGVSTLTTIQMHNTRTDTR